MFDLANSEVEWSPLCCVFAYGLPHSPFSLPLSLTHLCVRTHTHTHTHTQTLHASTSKRMYLNKFDTVVITSFNLKAHNPRETPLHLPLGNFMTRMRGQTRIAHILNLNVCIRSNDEQYRRDWVDRYSMLYIHTHTLGCSFRY